ncbi:MAG: serine hydrolase [Candidatus Promineifilaceae bacterium]|nr:serine hydrolase [Candidatus Promineifilaceae bacterium]
MLKLLRRWLIILLLIVGVLFLLLRGAQYWLAREKLPVGTEVAGVEVAGLTVEEAQARVSAAYSEPVYLYHRDDHVELGPDYVGFSLDMETMTADLQRQLDAREEWERFVAFVIERPLQPIVVPLRASHDAGGLTSMLQSIAGFLDEPARGPQMLSQHENVEGGQPGYVTDVEASLPLAEAALYRPDDRVAQLVVVDQEPPEMGMDVLRATIEGQLQTFDGLGSVFVMDLQTGEELAINADVAMSGLSILKIAIFVEAYRAIDAPPNPFQQQLFMDTATRSSNFGANLLLHEVAGENNTYRGADILTESMRRLGLENTFMAVPYDASPPAYRQTTYVTPANSRSDLPTQPDPTMQSTAEEIGTLLAMIYYCAEGGGTLLAVYPEQITPQECQEIIDLMILNEEGNLIRFGVPEGTPVSHKHGWARATHADAGIVFTPGGDYVLVEYLDQPGEWLLADESFPILREIARATYNYFNMDEPYLGDPLADRETIDTSDPFGEQQSATSTPVAAEPEEGAEAGGDAPTPSPEMEPETETSSE